MRCLSDVVPTLERYGRWTRNPQDPDLSSAGIEVLQQPFIDVLVQGGDIEELAERTSRRLLDATAGQSGWAVYGAYKLVEDMANDVDPPSKVELKLAGIGFLRAAGVSWNGHLSPNEKDFWVKHTGTGAQEWLPWGDPPVRESGPAPLGEGEVRHVATTLRPDGENRICLRRVDAGVQAVILYSDSDHELDWYTEPTIYDIYLRVAGALVTPPDWMAEDLKPYIPQPPMDFEAAAEAYRNR